LRGVLFVFSLMAQADSSENHRREVMQTTKRRSAEIWRAMVARFAQSGLSEEVFCQGEGVSAKLFHRWRMKRVRATPRAVEKPVRVAASPAATTGFVDLGSLQDGGPKLEMRLDLGGGVLLHVVRG
jgi:putative transposase